MGLGAGACQQRTGAGTVRPAWQLGQGSWSGMGVVLHTSLPGLSVAPGRAGSCCARESREQGSPPGQSGRAHVHLLLQRGCSPRSMDFESPGTSEFTCVCVSARARACVCVRAHV